MSKSMMKALWLVQVYVLFSMGLAACGSQGNEEISACDDGVKDGRETDVDCGGSCEPCGLGKRCLQDTDCESELTCEDGTCVRHCDGIEGPDGACRCEGGIWWELDFDTDPTKVDINDDNIPDWHLRDGSSFDTQEIVDGVWHAPAWKSLDSAPEWNFDVSTSIHLRFRATSVGDKGAVFWINADNTPQSQASIYAALTLQDGGGQTLSLFDKDATGEEEELASYPGLPDGFIDLWLSLDVEANKVTVWVQGELKGSYTYQTHGSPENAFATLLGYGSDAEFDFVRVESCPDGAMVPETPELPAAPTGLVATAVSASSVELRWSDNADNETDYQVEWRRSDEGSFTSSETLLADSSSHTVTGLEAETEYVFRVAAHNSAGLSEYSNEASATTESQPNNECGGNFTPRPLPSVIYNVLDYGLVGDGNTDDTDALNALAQNTDVTNWYFPAGHVFKLSRVRIPSHVEAVFGGGTLYSHDGGNTDPNQYVEGALVLNGTGQAAHDGFVLDGLTFVEDPNFTGHRGYGMFTITKHGSFSDAEIRNCTFVGSSNALNGIKVFSADDSVCTNLRVYGNTFRNIGGYFAIEVYHGGPTRPGYGEPGIKIFDNTISQSLGHGGISYVLLDGRSSGAEICNNIVDGAGMSIEIGAINVDVHHNLVLNSWGQAFSISSGATSHDFYDPTSQTLIHHNHVEIQTSDAYFYSYAGNHAEIFENYFKGHGYLRFQLPDSVLVLPNFHDNTVVYSDDGWAVQMYSDIGGTVESGSCHDNEIYNTADSPGARGLMVGNTQPDFDSTNNRIYVRNNSATCISTTGDDTGTICTQGYTGPVPDSRPGAGLLE